MTFPPICYYAWVQTDDMQAVRMSVRMQLCVHLLMEKNNFLQRFCWKSHSSSQIAGAQWIFIESHSYFVLYVGIAHICRIGKQSGRGDEDRKESLVWHCSSIVIAGGPNWQWDSQGVSKLGGHVFLALLKVTGQVLQYHLMGTQQLLKYTDPLASFPFRANAAAADSSQISHNFFVPF